MKVDKKTLLITDFEDIDKKKLLEEIKVAITNGKLNNYFREVGEEWMKLVGLDTSNFYLLSLSAIFPLKVFQSMVDNGYLMQNN